MKKKKTERPARPGRPLPAYTEYTHAGMRRDSVRPVVRTLSPTMKVLSRKCTG